MPLTPPTLMLNNGLSMPAFGLGTWKSAPGEVGRAVRTAISLGYRHIDCASIYGNEAEVGEAIAQAIAAGDVGREDLWVTSKLWNSEHKPEHVQPALQATLAKLRLDYVDLYLIHWPVAMTQDSTFPWTTDDFLSLDEVPVEATWEAMCNASDQGLSRAVGVSNMGPLRLAALQATGRTPAVNQVECHPFLQQRALRTYCDAQDIAVTGYSPLGSRDRSAALKGDDEPALLDHPVVAQVAARHTVEGEPASPAQVLIAWAITSGNVVIPKSTNAGRLQQNFDAQFLTLSASDMAELRTLDRGFRYVTGQIYTQPGSPYTQKSLWEL